MEVIIKQDSNGNKLTLQIVEGKIRIAITDNEIGMAVDLNDQEIENLIKCVKPDTKEQIEKWQNEIVDLKNSIIDAEITIRDAANRLKELNVEIPGQFHACKEFIRAITVVRKGELININVSVGNMGESYDKLRELYKKTGV